MDRAPDSTTASILDAHRVSTAVPAEFPALRAFVEWGLDMQLADAAELLHLPAPGLGFCAGQNFTCATALLNLIAGASVWLFDASIEGISARGERGQRFRGVVQDFWPWTGEGVDAPVGIDVLYGSARNPLSHTAGLPGPGDDPLVRFEKSPLTSTRVAELSVATERPRWLGPTIFPTAGTVPGTAYNVSVPGLYWSVQRLLRGLLTHSVQAAAANDVATDTLRRLSNPNAPWRRTPT